MNVNGISPLKPEDVKSTIDHMNYIVHYGVKGKKK